MADPTMGPNDPFIAEAKRHGWTYRMRDDRDHGLLRTRVAENTDECSECSDLWDQWVSLLMGAMIDGVGWWAGQEERDGA